MAITQGHKESEMKLKQDFGVTALIFVLVIIGAFTIIGIGMIQGVLQPDNVLYVLSGWVAGILSSYGAVKATKTGQNKE